MEYWYFNFEGKFSEDSPDYPKEGVVSGCLVPESDFIKAKNIFLSKLKENHISLVEMTESYSVNGEILDPDDEQNIFWIDWYKNVKKENQALFDIFYLFKE